VINLFIYCVSRSMDRSLSSGDDGSGGERGLLHSWRGYSYSVTPERLLLPGPVLQVALGRRHGVLLVEGSVVGFLTLILGYFLSSVTNRL